MPSPQLLRGARILLAPPTPEDAPVIARWQSDTSFLRLFDARPAYPQSEAELARWLEDRRKDEAVFLFAVHTVDDGALVGIVELDGIMWPHRHAWLSIAIGDPAERGKGYGGEAVALALDFAFGELNLHRIQLSVFSYNQPAIALYEKLGFTREGAYREHLRRDGVWYDMYLYGILSREWSAGRGAWGLRPDEEAR